MQTKTSKKKKPTAIDLFCGAGGLTLGLKKAGFSVLAGIELDKIAAQTYKLNHRKTLCLNTDIKNVSPEDLMKTLRLKRGELSLLAGCPPCQGFSSLRTKNRTTFVKDRRNDLLFQYLRFVKAFFPHSIMMENVPALARDTRITHLLAALKKLGYAVTESSVRVLPQNNGRLG